MRIIALAALAAMPGVAAAKGLFGGDRSDRFAVLDRRGAQQYAGSARLRPITTEVTTAAAAAAAAPTYLGGYRGPHLDAARAAARRHGVPEDLFARLVQRESAWDPDAVSHKGAIGLAQLMPDTAAGLGVNPHDPAQNLDGGARYLAAQHRRFGTWRLALAAYNAGPEVVARHGDVPPYAETRGYVTAILGAS